MKKQIIKKLKAAKKFVLFKWLLPLAFRWHSLKPIDEKLVVFADERDRSMPDNFISLYELCQEKGYRCEVLTGKSFSESVPVWKRRWAKLRYQFNFMRLYARCRAIFLVEYLSLAYITPARPQTDVVQLWHACGMIKNIAYAAYGTSWSAATLSDAAIKRYPMHNTYTLVAASSPRLCKYYARSFRCADSITQPLGVPRTDLYYDEEFKRQSVEKLHRLFPQIGDRKVIVYAPTFRGVSMKKSYVNVELDYRKMAERLEDKYVFVTKFHPLMAKGGPSEAGRLQAPNFLLDATTKLTPEEAVCVADIMISDYSSIMYDFMLLERPIISYIYDIDQYISDRGIVDPYDQLAPGPYAFTKDELTEALATVEDWFDVERIRDYRREFMSACDGHSTERIFNYVFGNKEEN